jgi:hypothetical protein
MAQILVYLALDKNDAMLHISSFRYFLQRVPHRALLNALESIDCVSTSCHPIAHSPSFLYVSVR